MTSNNKRVKGFTLIELIIVLVIIGILIAVLGPTMMGYIGRGRVKTQNTAARVIFNAAQTSVQAQKFREIKTQTGPVDLREMGNGSFVFIYDGTKAASSNDSNRIRGYKGGVKAYTGGETAGLSPCIISVVSGAPAGSKDNISYVGPLLDRSKTNKVPDFLDQMAYDINKVYSGGNKSVYKVYVENYKVVGVVSGRRDNDMYVGIYPRQPQTEHFAPITSKSKPFTKTQIPSILKADMPEVFKHVLASSDF